MKFPQFFPTILRIPNFFVKFPKPKKVGFVILDGLEMVAYGAKALWHSTEYKLQINQVLIYSKLATFVLGISNLVCEL